MQNISPFLWFDTQAEEAANFYVSVFRNSKITQIERYPAGTPGKEGSVMVVAFELNGQKFTALNGGPQFKFNESISLVVPCDTQEEIDGIWAALTADGGQEVQCGWLKDKYGVSWQVMPAMMYDLIRKNPEGVMGEVMKMVKLDIEKLKKAA